MGKKLNLGILYKNGKIVNHRSILKVILNPFLRTIGFEICSVFSNNNKFDKYEVRKLDKPQDFNFDLYSYNDFDKIEKIRQIL